jgi:hypothetical protein
MTGPDKDEREALLAAIAQAEKAVARASAELSQHEARLVELRSHLAHLPASPPARVESTLTTDRKLELFLSLFRGRTDVYPTRFVRKRDGQAGYAPDCRNKFVKGVCDLPRAVKRLRRGAARSADDLHVLRAQLLDRDKTSNPTAQSAGDAPSEKHPITEQR